MTHKRATVLIILGFGAFLLIKTQAVPVPNNALPLNRFTPEVEHMSSSPSTLGIMVAPVNTNAAGAKKDDVRFQLIPTRIIPMGQTGLIVLKIENLSDEKRTVVVGIRALSIENNGFTKHHLNLVESSSQPAEPNNKYKKTIELFPGQNEILTLALTPEQYVDYQSLFGTIRIFATGSVNETKQFWTQEHKTTLQKPKLIVQMPTNVTAKIPFTVRMQFTNPLSRELKNCYFSLSTTCTSHFQKFDFRNVQPNENVIHEVQVTPRYSGKCRGIARFASDLMRDVMGENAEV